MLPGLRIDGIGILPNTYNYCTNHMSSYNKCSLSPLVEVLGCYNKIQVISAWRVQIFTMRNLRIPCSSLATSTSLHSLNDGIGSGSWEYIVQIV